MTFHWKEIFMAKWYFKNDSFFIPTIQWDRMILPVCQRAIRIERWLWYNSFGLNINTPKKYEPSICSIWNQWRNLAFSIPRGYLIFYRFKVNRGFFKIIAIMASIISMTFKLKEVMKLVTERTEAIHRNITWLFSCYVKKTYWFVLFDKE